MLAVLLLLLLLLHLPGPSRGPSAASANISISRDNAQQRWQGGVARDHGLRLGRDHNLYCTRAESRQLSRHLHVRSPHYTNVHSYGTRRTAVYSTVRLCKPAKADFGA